MAKTYSIAIDGPAGAGKSTIARRLAKELGFYYVDTGAIYRTVAYFMDLLGISPKDVDGVERYIDELTISIEYDEEGAQHMIMNGMDVSDDIRTQDISQKASLVSAHSVVRDVLLDMQRDVAKKHNVIMDGRDIGTVVLPRAKVKIFLTAAPEVRAKRRYDELIAKGQKANLHQILKEIQQRDHQDMNRPIAPLKQAKDAVLVDTSVYPSGSLTFWRNGERTSSMPPAPSLSGFMIWWQMPGPRESFLSSSAPVPIRRWRALPAGVMTAGFLRPRRS